VAGEPLELSPHKLKPINHMTTRYILVNPHNYFIGIIDTLAPDGARYVKYWNDIKFMPQAKELFKKLTTNHNQ